MAFTAKMLSWRFRHLNIVGCLLKRRPTKGGGGHGHPNTPLATPLSELFDKSRRHFPSWLTQCLLCQHPSLVYVEGCLIYCIREKKDPSDLYYSSL